MKTVYKVFIGIGISFFILGLNILVIVLASSSWWWILITIILWGFGWGGTGIIILIIKIRKKPLLRMKLDMTTAERRAVHDVKYDENNPDNFKVNFRTIRHEGKTGMEQTPIAWFKGEGTETGATIHVLMNMNDPKGESLRVDNAPDDFIIQVIEKFAENPAEKVVEERTQTTDTYGRPIQTLKVTRATTAEKKEEKEIEEAKVKEAF